MGAHPWRPRIQQDMFGSIFENLLSGLCSIVVDCCDVFFLEYANPKTLTRNVTTKQKTRIVHVFFNQFAQCSVLEMKLRLFVLFAVCSPGLAGHPIGLRTAGGTQYHTASLQTRRLDLGRQLSWPQPARHRYRRSRCLRRCRRPMWAWASMHPHTM